MSEFYIFLMILPPMTILSHFWVKGIDHMKNNHPNYKGEDLI
jgi:hypothetical protein